MYSRFLFVLCFVLATTFANAQKENRYQFLKEKKQLCEQITNKLSGKPESIDSLISVGNEGLKACTAADHEYLFGFNQSVGIGYYYKQDFKQAKDHFEIAYAEAVKAGLVEKSLKPLGNLVSIYHYLGMQNKADEAALKLKQIADNTDTLKYKTDVYYNLGLYNQQQKFYYSIALENFLKSVGLHKPIADTTKILKRKLDYGVKLMMVAEIYLYLKQPNKALQYLNEVKPYLNLSIIVDVTAYGKFIRCFALLNNDKEALKYYNLLNKAVGDKPGKWSELVSSNIEMANLALKKDNLKLAKSYIDKANEKAKLGNNELLSSPVNILYGDYFKRINNNNEAGKYYKLAEHGSMVYNKEQYVELLRNLTDIEIKNGNVKDAGQYFSKYVSLSDSLNQRKISLNLAEMEARFQNEYKQQKIGDLNRENDDKSIQLSDAKKTRWFLIGGALLLLIALLSIYYNFRNKQKANLLLDKKNRELDIINEKLGASNQTKAKLFSIISHDLRSPVSQLFTFLKLQQSKTNLITEEEKEQHHQVLMKSSVNLLETMEDLLLWSKSQMDHFEIENEAVDVMVLFTSVTELMNTQATEKQLKLEIVKPEFDFLNSDYNLLQTILRNLLQNAINSSFENSIILLFAKINTDNQKYISILNQGAVIPAEKIESLMNAVHVKSKSTGYGLVIINELVEKIGAKLSITSSVEVGTEIKIVFN